MDDPVVGRQQPAQLQPTPGANPVWQSDPIVAPSAGDTAVVNSTLPESSPARHLLSELTMGLSDKASAAMQASGIGVGGVPGDDFIDRYRKDLTNVHAGNEQFATEHPNIALADKAAGVVAPLALVGAPEEAAGLVGRAAQMGNLGAGIGAAAGFGHAPDTSISGDLFYTGLGAATGGATGVASSLASDMAVKPIAQWVARRASPEAVDSQAVQKIFERIKQDTSGGGPGAQDMLDLLNLTPNKPQTLADVGGENLRGLAGNIARQPGDARQIATGFLNDRDLEAGQRIHSDIASGLSGGNAFDAAQALDEARRTAAQPLYEKAFSTNQNIASPAIDAVLNTPAGHKALTSASVKMQNDGALLGTPDATGVASGLNMRTLDYVKRSLDDQIGAARTSGERDNVRVLSGVKSRLVSALDDVDAKSGGFYAKARAAYSGPSQSLDALNEGQSFFRKSPDEINHEFSGLPDGDKEFYRLGAAQALRDKVARTGMGGDEAKKIIGSQYVRSQLRPLFGSDQKYNQFMNSVTAENRMFETRQALTGGSQTAGRLAEDGASSGKIMGPLLQMGSGVATGDWPNLMLGGKNLVGGIMSHVGSESPAVRAAIAQKLFSPDGTLNRGTLMDLLSQKPPRRLPFATVPLSSLSGQLSGPLAAALASGGTQ